MTPLTDRTPWRYGEHASEFHKAHGYIKYTQAFNPFLEAAARDPGLSAETRVILSTMRDSWGHFSEDAMSEYPRIDADDPLPKRRSQAQQADAWGISEARFSEVFTKLRKLGYAPGRGIGLRDQQTGNLFAQQRAPAGKAALRVESNSDSPGKIRGKPDAPPQSDSDSSKNWARFRAAYLLQNKELAEIIARDEQERDYHDAEASKRRENLKRHNRVILNAFKRSERDGGIKGEASDPEPPGALPFESDPPSGPPATAEADSPAQPTLWTWPPPPRPASPPVPVESDVPNQAPAESDADSLPAPPEPVGLGLPELTPELGSDIPAEIVRAPRTPIRDSRMVSDANPSAVNESDVSLSSLLKPETKPETTTTAVTLPPTQADPVVVVSRRLSTTEKNARKFVEDCRRFTPDATPEEMLAAIGQKEASIKKNRYPNWVPIVLETAPPLVPAIRERLAALRAEEQRVAAINLRSTRNYAIDTLRWVGDPSMAPHIDAQMLEDARQVLRAMVADPAVSDAERARVTELLCVNPAPGEPGWLDCPKCGNRSSLHPVAKVCVGACQEKGKSRGADA